MAHGLAPANTARDEITRDRLQWCEAAGAMDLAIGAKRTFVMMEHTTKTGEPKLVERCRYPLTGFARVSRIDADLAVLDITPLGVQVVEMAPGLSPAVEALFAQVPAGTAPSANPSAQARH